MQSCASYLIRIFRREYIIVLSIVICASVHAMGPETLGQRMLDSVKDGETLSQKGLENAFEQRLSEYRLVDRWQNSTVFRRALVEWLTRVHRGDSVEGAAYKLAEEKRYKPSELLYVAEQFFPDCLYSLSLTWLKNEQLSTEDLTRFANEGNHWHLQPSLLSDDSLWQVESFDRTVSLSLKNVPSFDAGELKYRSRGSKSWKTGLPVLPNPMQNSAGAVLLDLTADTGYEIQITLYEDGKRVMTRSTTVKTRTAPSFSENNVYPLREVVRDGVLDFKKAGIKRKPGEWIKIVQNNGNPLISSGDGGTIRVKNASYVYFHDIKLRGGAPHALLIEDSHDIWINGCEIADWGRRAHRYKKGKPYAKDDPESPINYDAGIAVRGSGRITIENCTIHSPRTGSNTWADGHPHGPTGILVDAAHPSVQYQGQIVIRNNTIRASDKERFNDAIESRHNGSMSGGFVRDSFIYGNTIAYANDDLIELDGSQRNVVVFDNVLDHGLCAVSAIPNRQGPSFIFRNQIGVLGDRRGKSFTAIKLGGGLVTPLGVTYVGHNTFSGPRYFVAAAGYRGDHYFWAHFDNNRINRKNKSSKNTPPLHNLKGKRVDATGL